VGFEDPVSQKRISRFRVKFEWPEVVLAVGFDYNVFLEVAILANFCLYKDRMLARWHIASEDKVIGKDFSHALFVVFTLDGGSVYQKWINVTQCFQFLD
jgi:hypothetical protein